MLIDIPVIMYHSVGVPDPSWHWHFLTVPWRVFESHISFLKSKGYVSLTIKEYYDHLIAGEPLPERSVLFTFDDGYLDNWVYVFPILKKYGMRGTIFVNPEFVDPSIICRPNLDDYKLGKITEPELPGMGFLSWTEMRAMESAKVMDIQSHGMTHTWYPCSPNIVDFRHPGDEYVWMDWNAAPELKWDYLRQGREATNRFGEPVYEHQKSLASRRFIPDSGLASHLIEFAKNNKDSFFSYSDWRNILNSEVDRYRALNSLDERFETDNEYRQRLEWELGESQRLIAENLGKEVLFFCWPGGGYCDESLEIAKQYYRSSTIASRDKSLAGLQANGHLRIRRIGAPCVTIREKLIYPRGRYLYHYIREHQGSKSHRVVRRILKLFNFENGTVSSNR